MNINMTGNTTGFFFGKDESSMALFAINNLVLSFQYKGCGVVVKRNGIFGDGPAISGVTGVTTDFHFLTMW
jgi:hypothetical protein